jgi:hypothetical protein
MFTREDIADMEQRGISPIKAKEQVLSFSKGFPHIMIDKPAKRGNGIVLPSEERTQELIEIFDTMRMKRQLLKFVPASGAATRMFKSLFEWHERLSTGEDFHEIANHEPSAKEFFERLPEIAFWDDLVSEMCKEDLNAYHLLDEDNYLPIINSILDEYGLDYASLPKGLIVFHRYDDHCRTAMEEHLVEGALYACDGHGIVRIHFTVSPSHLNEFKERIKKVVTRYAREHGVTYEISYSIQKPSTDTIAVDSNNKPFRDEKGSLVFRPGGHGALIENLNDLDADVVFIKNIDNVVPDHLKGPTTRYKKVLAGLLFDIQRKIAFWLGKLESGKLEDEDYRKAVEFASKELCIDERYFPEDAATGSEILFRLLNRPVRVCGMVKNEGEPGGGPFWVKNPETGMRSLQIIESSQVDMNNPGQAELFNGASHFNPVDLVCGMRDYKGGQFDLNQYIDHDTAFISNKSKDGKALKALELPGLWNGSMAGWITLFVEVPIITFNPVKVVNDLLRPEHQPA